MPTRRRPATQAKAAAETALSLDPKLAAAYGALGCASIATSWDWESAKRYFQEAIDVNPNYSIGHSYLAGFYSIAARFTDALACFRNALELDPLYVFAGQNLGCHYLRANRTTEARQQFERTLEISPDNPLLLWFMGETYLLDNRFDEGIGELERAAQLMERPATVVSALGWAHARADHLEEARRMRDELHSRRGETFVGYYDFAKIAAGMKDRDAAFAHLEEARQAREYLSLAVILVDETLRSLRGDPRFVDFIDRLRLRRYYDERDWPEDGFAE